MSKLYVLILNNLPYKDEVKIRWERDLLNSFEERDWLRLKTFNMSFSGNINIQENFNHAEMVFNTKLPGKNVFLWNRFMFKQNSHVVELQRSAEVWARGKWPN